jgi:diacylglycerol kinase
MKQQKFSFFKRLQSFRYAFNGIRILLLEEHNARIHVFIAICVIIAGFVFKVSIYEWLFLIMSIGIVLTLEIINSSIENIADFISPEKQDKIKVIKDLSAAAVFVGAITAAIIGFIVFIPKLIYFL